MSGRPADGSAGGPINITQLPLEQLEELRKQLQLEVNSLSTAYDSLNSASARFLSNRDVLREYEAVCGAPKSGEEKEEKEEEGLVCVSSALYARARLVRSGRVLVDVGTDYFLERPLEAATAYFATRAEAVRGNMDALEQKLRVAQTHLSQVVDTMRGRQAQQQQQQEAAAAAA
ncbi:prefoldin [Trypanosoma theileri]|uniref:Prefoldin n=1 Tax=Trypanosoma theileri TaxID=67003 RepID=A0A1X0NUY3_9TRYP|nr:prefoldin [Trypanosoma theileri]ORC87920.1 prefoldin [Trypanosoma theileri]